MPYFRVNPVAVDEGAAFVDVVVTLDAASSNEVKVNFESLNGIANYNSSQPDFQHVSGTLVFAPGQTSQTVRVNIVNNAGVEGTEAFWFALTSPVNATVAQRLAPVLVFDNDAVAGTPLMSISDLVVDETAGTASFSVWLDRPSINTVGARYATADGTATAGADYRAASGLLSFAPGEVLKVITIDLFDDTLPETDEVFSVVLDTVSNATLVDGNGQARIGHNDEALVSAPTISAQPVASDESQALSNVVVQLSAPSSNEVRVNYDFLNGTANYNSSQPDFQSNSGTLVFAPGQTTIVVSAPVVDNSTVEGPGVFWLALSSPVNAVVPQRLTPIIAYDNDATAGTPGIDVSDAVVDETVGTVSFFVTLDKPSVNVVTVSAHSVDGTAVAGQDYRAVSATLSFAPGETVKTVSVEILDDTVPETDEVFHLLLSNPANATLTDNLGDVRIGHNDAAVESLPMLSARPVASDESQPMSPFVVQLSAPSNNEVRVNYDFLNGTANYNSSQPDFQSNSGTLVFAPGQTTLVVSAPVVDNTTVEDAGLFWLALATPVNAVLQQRLTPALAFDNDSVAGTPAISVGDAIVDETSGTASFFVWLDRPSANVVGVAYRTADDTAAAGSDYRAADGVLHFAPGETVKTVTVDIVDDGLAETDECFELLLGQPTNATLGDAVGAALIMHNDTARVSLPQLSSSPVTVSEADVAAHFVVQLSAPSSNEVRVNYSFVNGTANYNSSQPDFQTHSGTLVFAPGQTAVVVSAPLVNNTLAENNETFALDLTAPVNATVPQRQTTATVIDDDSGFKVLSHGIGDDLYTVTATSDRIAESVRGGIDTVLASVSWTLPDNVENLVLTGSASSGIGNAANNVFKGTSGNNSFDGGAGIDTVVFSGPRSGHSIVGNVAQQTVSGGGDGSDTLFSIERLQFADTVIASDTSPGGDTYLAYAMLNAAFNTAPSTADLSRWTAVLDQLGGRANDLAQTMISTYAPGVPDDVLVSHLWSTIVGGTIPAASLAEFTGLLADGTFTQASLLAFVSTYELNTVELVGVVGQPLALDPAYFPVPGA